MGEETGEEMGEEMAAQRNEGSILRGLIDTALGL